MTTQQKLEILADAAKYDASCASSGAKRTATPGGLGSTDGIGICHSYNPYGRCVSLLKILLTNESTMSSIAERIDSSAEDRKNSKVARHLKPKQFAAAGQSTQMVIGATPATDRQILTTATHLYSQHKLRRIYYTGFSPYPEADARLPLKGAPPHAGAPPLPVRLAHALLRLRGRRAHLRGRPRALSHRRPQIHLGPYPPRVLPRGRQRRPPASPSSASPASATAT